MYAMAQVPSQTLDVTQPSPVGTTSSGSSEYGDYPVKQETPYDEDSRRQGGHSGFTSGSSDAGEFRYGGGDFRNGGGEFRNGAGEFRNGAAEFRNGAGDFRNGATEFIKTEQQVQYGGYAHNQRAGSEYEQSKYGMHQNADSNSPPIAPPSQPTPPPSHQPAPVPPYGHFKHPLYPPEHGVYPGYPLFQQTYPQHSFPGLAQVKQEFGADRQAHYPPYPPPQRTRSPPGSGPQRMALTPQQVRALEHALATEKSPDSTLFRTLEQQLDIPYSRIVAWFDQQGVKVILPNGKKYRRARTIFSNQQQRTLEFLFARNAYYSREKYIEIAGDMGLDYKTVKVWFQNRRSKDKKLRKRKLANGTLLSTNAEAESDHTKENHNDSNEHQNESSPESPVPSEAPSTSSTPDLVHGVGEWNSGAHGMMQGPSIPAEMQPLLQPPFQSYPGMPHMPPPHLAHWAPMWARMGDSKPKEAPV